MHITIKEQQNHIFIHILRSHRILQKWGGVYFPKLHETSGSLNFRDGRALLSKLENGNQDYDRSMVTHVSEIERKKKAGKTCENGEFDALLVYLWSQERA